MHQPSPVPSVSPVIYKGSRGGQQVRAIHHPFPQSTIRDLCKAHRDYGWDSPYFRGLLCSDLDATVVIPADLKQLFSCLLDSTEFKLWVAAWRQQLREALPSLLRDPETAVDDNGNPLTLEHLMGEGRWADPSDQTSDIPIKALQIAREHAVSAFFGMVPDGPVVPFYKIMQGAKESFTKFVERLTRAIEVQVTEVVVSIRPSSGTSVPAHCLGSKNDRRSWSEILGLEGQKGHTIWSRGDVVSTPHSPTINHLAASLEDRREEEELDQEEVLEGAPDDEEERNPDEEEHGLGYPTQHH
ncbi:hypothetical protein DUI87_30661 [Hirundo rustica rustica]|uniref:Uncharacterized protein n=1 Tax=Hirundo rustica rustica TaxID=333673 RepID=A0A3M0J1Q7_HIRRU|nr:hypothetical protein DUI87_30661 [Hirundo rustica rustica]